MNESSARTIQKTAGRAGARAARPARADPGPGVSDFLLFISPCAQAGDLSRRSAMPGSSTSTGVRYRDFDRHQRDREDALCATPPARGSHIWGASAWLLVGLHPKLHPRAQRDVTLLLTGVVDGDSGATALESLSVRAAAAAAAANSGPIIGTLVYPRGAASPPPYLLPVNGLCISRLCRPCLHPCDSGSRAWGPGAVELRARVVLNSRKRPVLIR